MAQENLLHAHKIEQGNGASHLSISCLRSAWLLLKNRRGIGISVPLDSSVPIAPPLSLLLVFAWHNYSVSYYKYQPLQITLMETYQTYAGLLMAYTL